MYARHLPTMQFSADDFNAMPALREDEFAPDGFSHFADQRGKAIVIFSPPFDPGERVQTGHYAVRPIVRIPARTEMV